jgi:hypothetical protein
VLQGEARRSQRQKRIPDNIALTKKWRVEGK